MIAYLEREQLEARRVYELHSRNLAYGAWRPEKNDFVGIRTKFNARFLDSEVFAYTAYPMSATDHVVPDEIQLAEYMTSIDEVTGRPVDFDRPLKDGGRGWYFLDGEQEANEEIRAFAPMNKELFAFLDAIEVET